MTLFGRIFFFGVFAVFIATQLEDCSGQGIQFSGSVSAAEGGGFAASDTLSGILKAIGSVIKVPLSLLTTPVKIFYKFVIKPPLSIAAKIVSLILNLVQGINNVNADVLNKILDLIRPIVEGGLSVLVNIGVLGGTGFEDVLYAINNLITLVLTGIIDNFTSINTFIVTFISNLIAELKIKETILNILSLPIVKEISDFLVTLHSFIKENFQHQIDEIVDMLKRQYEAHKDFFQPILDGISSRILIGVNALGAIISGNLQACPGEVQVIGTPTDALIWHVKDLIYLKDLNILKFLGFWNLADKVQEKLDVLALSTIQPPSGGIGYY